MAAVPPHLTPVFRAGRQGMKVHFIQGLSVVCLAGALLAAVSLAGPPPPGDTASRLVRSLLAVAVLALGVGFVGGMLYYGRIYVSLVRYDAQERCFRLTMLGPPRRHLTCTDAGLGGRAAYHTGHFETVTQHVQAPWYTLRLPGVRPLLLDPQGDIEDERLWRRLTHGA